MKMRGLADQLVTWMLILLVIFTGTTLAQLDREQLLVQIRANISKISDGKTVSKNDTYLLLDHDYYFQEDFIDGAIDKDVLDKTIRPNFQMKLFGTEYDAVDVYAAGVLITQNSKERVIIEPLVHSFGGVHIQSVQTDDFLAIRWPQLRFLSDSTSHTVKIIVVLYKNGIITMKYEEIPSEIHSADLKSTISVEGTIFDNRVHFSTIQVPRFMIRTGTVVNFIPAPKYCSKESSQEACSNASTPEIGCFWCEKHHACTNKFDKNAQIWYENDCNKPKTGMNTVIYLTIGMTLFLLLTIPAIRNWSRKY
ncbi:egg protein [Schistosoma japonicum]|nr:egg protein [Schistosoma japonicum]